MDFYGNVVALDCFFPRNRGRRMKKSSKKKFMPVSRISHCKCELQ